jgi:hypothetical protein
MLRKVVVGALLCCLLVAAAEAQAVDPDNPDSGRTTNDNSLCDVSYADCRNKCLPKLPQLTCRSNVVLEACACVSSATALGKVRPSRPCGVALHMALP